ncbi:hypothetical protein NG895_17155 [Aeoliella sp. ICT_H6.2]|uniref:Uncharacterized protein n=1 Tax=Aeoliella straminimaris TaxID=2954799 RepID=A0A9X2JIE1_9BACT|nr:hypothetical protein [Aeoliella straminimaris]MCO6045628.1 hypothetical protein [Aeoliella straminimaris]
MDHWLCDSCQRDRAVHHLVESQPNGMSVEWHLCDRCFQVRSALQDVGCVDLRNKVCQMCGAPAKIASGVPPLEKIMCYECACRDLDSRG